MRWTNVFRGFVMGIVELIPGVSSGTIALLLGIYEQLLSSIKGIVHKQFKSSMRFLVPLVIGMGLAIVTLSGVITYFLEEHPIPTQWMFIGLVAGIVPMLWRLARVKETFKIPHVAALLITLGLLIVMSFITPNELVSQPDINMSLLIQLFFAGFLAAMTLLLPGISGSLALLILGYYYIIIAAIDDLTSLNLSGLPILIATGLGILVGLYMGSVVITYLLSRFTYITYAAVMGLVIGSVFSIYPGLPTSLSMTVITFVMLIAGFLVSYIMGRAGEKEARSYND